MKILRLIRFFAFAFLIFSAVYVSLLFIQGRPAIEGIEKLQKLPKKKEVTLKVISNWDNNRVSVKIIQEGREIKIFEDSVMGGETPINLLIEPKKYGLKDGEAKVIVTIDAYILVRRSYTVDTFIDTVPPKIYLIASTPIVKQGSSGAVKTQTTDAERVVVMVGKKEYPLYRMDKNTFFGIFPVDVEEDPNTYIKIVAYDRVGNTASITLPTKIRRTRFKRYVVDITDDMIRRKILPLLGDEGEGLSPVDAFKKVNEEWRERDEKKISEIGKKSEPRKLWEGRFLQLKNSKVISYFGELRYYRYKGRIVSKSRHLGYDLASIKNAKVQAANNGVVVYVGDLGIYGNTIIIDHGLGVMSLYSHLGSMLVKEGEYVRKGQIIGTTDMTGLAFGDHLHFGIIVQGVEVTPLEWWDPKWLKNNIERIMNS